MKIKVVLVAGLLFLTLACDKAGTIYSEYDRSFEANRWIPSDAKTHEFTIADDSKSYDLVLRFGHVYDYQFASIPLVVVITDPSAREEKMQLDLLIRDELGKQLADCSGDVCDLEMKLKEKTNLEKGTYKVTITQAFAGPYVPNVLGVGLDVRASQ